MIKSILKVLLFLLFQLGEVVYCQEIWTLDDCINYAMQNNIQIRRKEIQQNSQSIILKESKNFILPDLRLNLSQYFSYGKTNSPYTSNLLKNNIEFNDFFVSSSLTLFNGLNTYQQIQQNQLNLSASLLETEALKDDIRLNILKAYLQILLNDEELQKSKNQVLITQEQLENAKKLFEAAIIALSDIYEIESQVSYEKYLITIAENNLTNSYSDLLKILEKKNTSITIAKPVLKVIESDLLLPRFEDVFESAQKMPYIKSAEYQMKSIEREKEIIKSQLYPEITVKFGLYTKYSSGNLLLDSNNNVLFKKQFKDNILPTITLNLSYPIFNKFSYKTAKDKVKIKIEDSELNLKQTRNELYYAIQQIYNNLNAFISEYQSSSEYLKSMQISFKNAELKFSAGKNTSYDYNLSKTKLIKAESDLLKVKYEIIFNQNILNYYSQLPFQL